jgi:RNA polymerase sigma-B factor
MAQMRSFTVGLDAVGRSPRRRERLLFRRFAETRDRAARDALVEMFMPLTHRVAAEFSNGRIPVEDLRQVAAMGLLGAIERFDCERGIPFTAFAVATMSGAIKRHHRDALWSVHVPRRLKESALRVDRMVAERLGAGHDAVGIDRIAVAAGLSPDETAEALQVLTVLRAKSLEDLRMNHGDLDERGEEDRGFEQVETRATLVPLLCALEERDRAILRLRFEEDMTQDRIAEQLGISQMHVSRRITRALTTLRDEAEGR